MLSKLAPSSRLSEAKKASATALSSESPIVPMDWVTSWRVQRVAKAAEVYWADSTGRRNTPSTGGVDGTTTGLGCDRDRKAADAVAWPAAGRAA
jgi:hypothetical protein